MGASLPKHIINNEDIKMCKNKHIVIMYDEMVKIQIYDKSTKLIYVISAPYWAGHEVGISGIVEDMSCVWIKEDTYGCFFEDADIVHKLYIKLYNCKEIYIDSIYGWRGKNI